MDDSDTPHRRSNTQNWDILWALTTPAAQMADRPGAFRSRR